MKKSISVWQMIGFVFTGVLGTLLHFLYDWTGQNPVVGAFSAVNESIGEHMKLLYFPMVVFAVWEYFVLGKDHTGFWWVKLLGTTLGLILIPGIYYTYTGALGVKADWFNIAIFFIVAAVVFWAETKFLQRGLLRWGYSLFPFGVLVAMGIAFVMLTFSPPKLPLFQP